MKFGYELSGTGIDELCWKAGRVPQGRKCTINREIIAEAARNGGCQACRVCVPEKGFRYSEIQRFEIPTREFKSGKLVDVGSIASPSVDLRSGSKVFMCALVQNNWTIGSLFH